MLTILVVSWYISGVGYVPQWSMVVHPETICTSVAGNAQRCVKQTANEVCERMAKDHTVPKSKGDCTVLLDFDAKDTIKTLESK